MVFDPAFFDPDFFDVDSGDTDANAGASTGSGSAFGASVSIKPNSASSSGTGSASSAAASVASSSGAGSGSGTSGGPSSSVSASTGLGSGTGSALDATVSVATGTSASAEVASGTGSSLGASETVKPGASVASGTGTSSTATPRVRPSAGLASGTGAASSSTVQIGAVARPSTATGTGSGSGMGPGAIGSGGLGGTTGGSGMGSGGGGTGLGSGGSGDDALPPTIFAVSGGEFGYIQQQAGVVHSFEGDFVAATTGPFDATQAKYSGVAEKITSHEDSPAQWDDSEIYGPDYPYGVYRGRSDAIHVFGVPVARTPPPRIPACKCCEEAGRFGSPLCSDTFTRTESVGLGESEFDGTPTWVEMALTGGEASVDGSRAHLVAGDLAGAEYSSHMASLIPVAGPVREYLVAFSITGTDSHNGWTGRFFFCDIEWDPITPGAGVELLIGWSGSTPNKLTEQIVAHATTGSALGSAVVLPFGPTDVRGNQLKARLRMDGTTSPNVFSSRVWEASGAEPATWDTTRDVTPGVDFAMASFTKINLVAGANVAKTVELIVDKIEITEGCSSIGSDTDHALGDCVDECDSPAVVVGATQSWNNKAWAGGATHQWTREQTPLNDVEAYGRGVGYPPATTPAWYPEGNHYAEAHFDTALADPEQLISVERFSRTYIRHLAPDGATHVVLKMRVYGEESQMLDANLGDIPDGPRSIPWEIKTWSGADWSSSATGATAETSYNLVDVGSLIASGSVIPRGADMPEALPPIGSGYIFGEQENDLVEVTIPVDIDGSVRFCIYVPESLGEFNSVDIHNPGEPDSALTGMVGQRWPDFGLDPPLQGGSPGDIFPDVDDSRLANTAIRMAKQNTNSWTTDQYQLIFYDGDPDEISGPCNDCEDCEDPGNPGFPIPDFEPGYMPTFRRQIGDPTTGLDSFICTLESAAMVLDWHTRGAVKVWGGELIPWCGKTEAQIQGVGTNLGNAQQAWAHYGQILSVRSGQTWNDLMACLAEGRAVILQGDYGEFSLAERCQDDFVDNHAISVYPYQQADRLLVGDPICLDFKGFKISSLQAYAEALGAAVFGVQSPQPILFAVSRPWTP